MGLIKAVLGIVSPELRVRQTLENFLGYYRASSRVGIAPCIALYDTFVAMAGHPFRPEFCNPPVSNGLSSLYSCLTPPNSVVALAHQFNILLEPARYTRPGSRNAEEFRILMRELLDETGELDRRILQDRFEAVNGHSVIQHPRAGIVLGISEETPRLFDLANMGGVIWWVLAQPAGGHATL